MQLIVPLALLEFLKNELPAGKAFKNYTECGRRREKVLGVIFKKQNQGQVK